MNLAKYDLNLLVTLNALLAERSVTRAAKRLGLSQSTVSGSLAKLREMFDDELLVRVGRGSELTPFAQQIMEDVQQTVRGIEALLSTRRDFEPATERRTFRIAARDYLAFLLLPELIRRLKEEAPQIAVCFSPLDAGSLPLLGEDRLDFALLPEGYQDTFPARPLFEDRWVCGVWSGHPTVGETLSLDEYLSLDHVIFMPGPGNRVATRPLVSATDLNRRAVASVESFVLMPFLLRDTDLVALIPERLARQVEGMAEIRLLKPPHAIRPLRQTVCWNPRRSQDPSHQWMRDLIVETARGLPTPSGSTTPPPAAERSAKE